MKTRKIDMENMTKLGDMESAQRVKEAKSRIMKGVYTSDFILDDLVDRFVDAISID